MPATPNDPSTAWASENSPVPPEITVLLSRVRGGDRLSMEVVANWLDERLRFELRRRSPWSLQGLEITHIINEVFLRLLRHNHWMHSKSRRHLINTSLRAVRQVIVDYARGCNAQKRGGLTPRFGLDAYLLSLSRRGIRFPELHEALERLHELNARHFEVVQMRYFGGFTFPEIAELLQVSLSTVESDWRTARGWLYRELADQ